MAKFPSVRYRMIPNQAEKTGDGMAPESRNVSCCEMISSLIPNLIYVSEPSQQLYFDVLVRLTLPFCLGSGNGIWKQTVPTPLRGSLKARTTMLYMLTCRLCIFFDL